MTLFNINPDRRDFPPIQSVKGFRLLRWQAAELVFETDPNQIHHQQIFAFESSFWSVTQLHPTPSFALFAQPRYTAVRLYGFILRGNVQPCEGMMFLTPELPLFVKLPFHRLGHAVRTAVFTRGKDAGGGDRTEGDNVLYFFDKWEK